MEASEIISKLPYSDPFLFVDSLEKISNSGIEGSYTFNENAFFYKGHFKNHPITPGVILTECMAQIGVVCLGIYLMGISETSEIVHTENLNIAMTTQNIEFYKTVYPNETVRVISEKIYFRFNKLKCKVRMLNEKQETVALGEISGMLM